MKKVVATPSRQSICSKPCLAGGEIWCKVYSLTGRRPTDPGPLLRNNASRYVVPPPRQQNSPTVSLLNTPKLGRPRLNLPRNFRLNKHEPLGILYEALCAQETRRTPERKYSPAQLLCAKRNAAKYFKAMLLPSAMLL